MSRPIMLAWSGGKDSMLALVELQASPDFDVVGFLTTLTVPGESVALHGVSRELIQAQADALQIPLTEIWIPANCDNATYEAAWIKAMQDVQQRGVESVAFGDLFLDDIRSYRENLMQQCGMESHFPLWGADTRVLAHRLISQGMRAVTCCIDAEQLSESFCGREFDLTFLEALPHHVDPCGENGEFHTFVYKAPTMTGPVEINIGATRRGPRFIQTDLAPVHQLAFTSGDD